MKRIVVAFLTVAALAGPAAAAELNVVASFSILGDMVARIGAERVAVTTIVGPDSDTHVYQPTPADARALSGAGVFVVNGLGFEGWMDRLVGSTGFGGPVVVASAGITSNTMDEDGVEVADPHAWQSLANGVAYARNIVAGLCAADAAGCAIYEANGVAYTGELQTLDAEVKAQLAATPADRRKVITTHDAFGYFAAAYDVAFLAPEGISTESEAAAADVARLIRQVRETGVKALFIENMSDPRLVSQIADETGVALGGELYSDALSPPDGPAGTYLEMFRHNVALLAGAMGGD